MIPISAVSRRPAALRAVAAALVMGLFGCSVSERVTAPVSPSPPAADSPVHALDLMKWSWEARDLSRYSTLLPADFGGRSVVADTAGNSYRTIPWTRDDELVYAANLFSTATSIRLDFAGSLEPQPDLRPGVSYPWHQVIYASMTLAVTTPTHTTQSTEVSAFYLVRGDSAVLTPVMILSGMPADSSRWYIERRDQQAKIGAATP